MRPIGLLAAALVLPLMLGPAADAQTDDTVSIELTATLEPGTGRARMDLRVVDRGPVVELRLDFRQVATLDGAPSLTGSWTRDAEQDVADLEADPDARAQWTADARILVESVEGKGHTSYVGPTFAIVKLSDLMPSLQYSFPENRDPAFETRLEVVTPADWRTVGPWPRANGAFLIDSVIPRGFVAAGVEIEEATLTAAGQAYRVVRIAGAREPDTTQQLLTTSETFLAGLYGAHPEHRFVVVGPDPMFLGGLGNPAGIFLHEEADASVVAHELVHTYQWFQPSRRPGEASVWLAEGTAVLHGAMLEAAAGIRDRAQVMADLEDDEKKAKQRDGVDLTTAVYGSTNERAAYTKGAVVVSAMNQVLRDASDGAYTLPDVLRQANVDAQATQPSPQLTTSAFEELVGEVTRFDLREFFEDYVRGADVPPLGVVFPGTAALRILGTTPEHPVALEPFDVRVAMTNLDVEPVQVDAPLMVNGTDASRVVATLRPGETAEATATVTSLRRGSYELQLEGSTYELRVLAPALPTGAIEVWPPTPVARRATTVGLTIANDGEAPFDGRVRLVVDGQVVEERDVTVRGGDAAQLAATLAGLAPGPHAIEGQGADGVVLATQTIEVGPEPSQGTPAPTAWLAVAVVSLVAAVLAPRHRRTR